LVNQAQPAGPYRVQWDGRDERGAQVSSGIYFAKLAVGGETHTRKMVMLK